MAWPHQSQNADLQAGEKRNFGEAAADHRMGRRNHGLDKAEIQWPFGAGSGHAPAATRQAGPKIMGLCQRCEFGRAGRHDEVIACRKLPFIEPLSHHFAAALNANNAQTRPAKQSDFANFLPDQAALAHQRQLR